MKVFTAAGKLNEFIDPLRGTKKIGLIPTMGALHEGHLSLVERGLEENDLVVVSIFVNPTQFDNAGDLKKYPRTLDADIALLKTLKGTILIFVPEAVELYQGTVVSKKYNFGSLENEMEGKHRKGHFDGVGTVVNLLFRAILPTRAYFGEKDFQQLQIVKKLVEIEKLSVDIIGCEIVREDSGLAMSSRNKRLSATQKEEAALISKTLKAVQKDFRKKSIHELNTFVKEAFASNPHLKLEYFEIANTKTLKTAFRKRKNSSYRAFIAAFAGEVRLIDNMALK
ncbi:pantoate--beta-alanine ligase [Jejudonia soesokkakensis]|uniref:Pantothenate synthetase n=1 Tax=Jejudonia soesokkakensis TaxID=1323432 RepID=A0ABW2MQI2_9FLAO